MDRRSGGDPGTGLLADATAGDLCPAIDEMLTPLHAAEESVVMEYELFINDQHASATTRRVGREPQTSEPQTSAASRGRRSAFLIVGALLIALLSPMTALAAEPRSAPADGTPWAAEPVVVQQVTSARIASTGGPAWDEDELDPGRGPMEGIVLRIVSLVTGCLPG